MNVFLVDFENVNSPGLNGINRLDSSDQVVIFYSENADSMTFDLHEQINNSKAYIFFQKVEVGTKNALDFQLATYLGYLVCENEKADRDVYYYLVTRDHGYTSLVNYWTKHGIDIAQVGSLNSGKIVRDVEPEDAEEPESEQEPVAAPEEPIPESAPDEEEKKGKGKGRAKSKKADKDGEEKKSKSDKEAKDGEEKKPKSGKKGRKKKEETPEEKELRIQVENVVPDKDVVDLVVSYIQKYKTKLGINNALAKEFKDSKKASEIYKSIKPLIADKKGQ